MQYFDEQERRRRRDGFLSTVRTVRGVQVAQPTVHELDPRSLSLLTKFALEPCTTLTEAYSALGQHPAEGKASVDDLLARGFVRMHRLCAGRGGQPTVVQVLPAGRQELEKRGIMPAEKKLKRGGFMHDVYARFLEKWARAHGYHYWFERTLGQKAFDFVIEDKAGNLVGIEICLSGSAEWTARMILKGAEVEGIQRVIAACERKGFVQLVMDEICKIDQLGLYRNKIVGKLLSEYLG